MERPLFLTFEGLDGSGKSTHLRRAQQWLEDLGVPFTVTHEPGGTPLGEQIRGLFLDPAWGSLDGGVELLLMFASRRQHLLQVIDPALADGRHVLCDRFTDSTFAYQGHGRGVSLDLIERVDMAATGGRRPDRTLLFDVAPEVAWNRGNVGRRRRGRAVDRLDREDLEFYARVREGFLARARGDPERFIVVGSGGPVEETQRQVQQALADVLACGGQEESVGACGGH